MDLKSFKNKCWIGSSTPSSACKQVLNTPTLPGERKTTPNTPKQGSSSGSNRGSGLTRRLHKKDN